MKIVEVMEDNPVCRTEKISSYAGNSTSSRQVEVNRCEIKRRTVRRAKPETSCKRIPSRLCAWQQCKEGRVECADEVLNGVEQVPVETCQLVPQEDCQQVGGICRTLVRRICKRPGRRKAASRRNNGRQRGGNVIQVGRRKRIQKGKRRRKVVKV